MREESATWAGWGQESKETETKSRSARGKGEERVTWASEGQLKGARGKTRPPAGGSGRMGAVAGRQPPGVGTRPKTAGVEMQRKETEIETRF